MLIKESSTTPICFLMVLSSDHITGATGLTPTVTISKAGAAFASPAGTVAEIANGWYKLTPTSADTGTLGELLLHASAATADPVDDRVRIVAFDPDAAANLGLTDLDAAISTRATPAQILTTPANLLATDASGRVTVGTNADKTGYALTAGEHTSIATDAQTGLTAQGYTATRAGYLDTLNGLVAAIWANATRTVTSLAGNALDVAGAVWNAVSGSYSTSGSTGAALLAAGSAGDPWATDLPGAYGVGTAGHTVGTNLDAAVSSRAAIADYTSARAAKLDDLDAAVSSRLATSGYTTPPTTAQVAAVILKTPANLLATNTSGQVDLDMTQSVPTSNTAQTIGDALNAARAQGFGAWKIVGTTVTMYANDGVTAIHSFTLDSATAPTSRT